ncbi:MAG: hypothetical protein EOM80_00005 [Erysipelotrichia bacterium]|nr:hypothetical protein [Erysipelotrichia bacterium]
MKNKIFIVVLLAILTVSTGLPAAERWMTRAPLQVSQPGLVETVVLPQLHRSYSGLTKNNTLDISLVGPDGNLRAFELFWKSAGDSQVIQLTAEKATLLNDRRILWEASLPQGHDYSSLKITVSGSNYTGKVDFEGLIAGQWSVLATGTMLAPDNAGSVASIVFPAAQYERIRCYFTGFDRHFKKTPVFVKAAEVSAKKQGSDFARSVVMPQIEQASIEDGLEARIFLPGSGLRIETVEIFTSAQFKGDWQVGREKIHLGKRDFMPVTVGEATSVGDEPKRLVIDLPGVWDKRTMLVRLKSDNFFGKIEQIKVNVVLPRMLFVADQSGEYFLQTGLDKAASVLNAPETTSITSAKLLEFSTSFDNPEWQAENLLKNYSAKGAPFNSDGYTWKSAFSVDKPGFYQLQTSEQISLDKYRDSWRIVSNDTQVPYFPGVPELREFDIKVESSYESAANRSVYIIKLPADSVRLSAVRFKSTGVFNRTLFFEKHEPGEISWQPWMSRIWSNNSDNESTFNLSLVNFPEDQHEIRMYIDHGNNRPIEIAGYKGFYTAQDLFFIVDEPGTFFLTGGNPKVRAPIYDLAMVEDALAETVPAKVHPGACEAIDMSVGSGSAHVDQGAPFVDAGYSWVATFSVPIEGFYQLGLNLKAALDNNPKGMRLVHNAQQVPFFFGNSIETSLDIASTMQYNRDNNTSYYEISLPAASKQWRELELSAAGVFSRNMVLEIRKPGKLGWKIFKKNSWVNRSDGSSNHKISIDRLPEGEKDLRLVIDHGDNSPVSLTAIKASYQSQTMLFQASQAGEYKVYGGNAKAGAPRYDLALIKDNMLKKEPQRLQLLETAEYSSAGQISRQLDEAFSDRGWGIYLVLGLVTALLLVMIIKLFPEEPKKPEQQE